VRLISNVRNINEMNREDYSHTRCKCSTSFMLGVILVTFAMCSFMVYKLIHVADRPSIIINEHEYRKGDSDYEDGLLLGKLTIGILAGISGCLGLYFSTILLLDIFKPKDRLHFNNSEFSDS